MIIFAQCVIIMIMPHTCVEPHARALQSVFTVATPTTGQVIAPETHGTTENNRMQHLTLRQHNQQANTKNSGNAHGNAATAGPGASRHSSQSHP